MEIYPEVVSLAAATASWTSLLWLAPSDGLGGFVCVSATAVLLSAGSPHGWTGGDGTVCLLATVCVVAASVSSSGSGSPLTETSFLGCVFVLMLICAKAADDKLSYLTRLASAAQVNASLRLLKWCMSPKLNPANYQVEPGTKTAIGAAAAATLFVSHTHSRASCPTCVSLAVAALWIIAVAAALESEVTLRPKMEPAIGRQCSVASGLAPALGLLVSTVALLGRPRGVKMVV